MLVQILMAAAVLGLVVILCPVGRRPKNYPPGPPTLPIIGNIHQLPKKDVHVQLEKWARQYGPVYSLILGTKVLVVLSQDKAVRDLLDRRSGIYSDREENYYAQVLCSGDRRFGFLRYGPKWRIFRKLAHVLLSVTQSRSYIPYQDLENKQMLYEMIEQPDRFLYNIRRHTNAITTSMVFGWRTPTYDDEKMQQLFDGFTEFARMTTTGAASLIEFYPWLRKLPEFLYPAKKAAREHHDHERALYLGHWLKAKEDLNNGTLNKCFCEEMIKAQKDGREFEDVEASYVSGTLLEAGSDTTSNTLYGFVQAMLLFPETQKKAQEELDRVVGSDRLPDMDDMEKLPYIRACMKETVRWMPTTLLGAVPHAVTRDDYYEGHLIPKGASVLNNVWAIHMDPQRHPNPRTFNPERYIGDDLSFENSAIRADYSNRDHFTFGAGRRLCPGIHLAENSLYLAMSRLLWGFKIEAVVQDGKPILPDPDKLTQGFVCMPEEYPAKITPRSQAHEDIMVNAWKKAEQDCLDPETKQWRQTPV